MKSAKLDFRGIIKRRGLFCETLLIFHRHRPTPKRAFCFKSFSLSFPFPYTYSLDDMMIKTGANYLTIINNEITHFQRKSFVEKADGEREGQRRTGKLSNLWKRIKMINGCQCFYNKREHEFLKQGQSRQALCWVRIDWTVATMHREKTSMDDLHLCYQRKPRVAPQLFHMQ